MPLANRKDKILDNEGELALLDKMEIFQDPLGQSCSKCTIE